MAREETKSTRNQNRTLERQTRSRHAAEGSLVEALLTSNAAASLAWL